MCVCVSHPGLQCKAGASLCRRRGVVLKLWLAPHIVDAISVSGVSHRVGARLCAGHMPGRALRELSRTCTQ